MSALVHGLLQVLALLPRRLLQFLGSIVGRLHALLDSRSAQVTRANLALCLPGQEDELTLPSLIETGKSVFESPAVWLGNLNRVDQWIAEVHGESLLRAKLESSRGLLILLPHIGNWELFNVFFRRYGSMTALYQPPRLEAMQQLMAKVRSQHGNRMVPTTRAGLKQLYRALNNGETVVVLPDQVPASGVYAPFFGQAALTDGLAGRLLNRTGAAALALSIIRRADGRFDVHLQEAPDDIYCDDERSVVAVNQMVERAVSLAPAQYQWEYKRFRERPAGELKLYRFGKPPRHHR